MIQAQKQSPLFTMSPTIGHFLLFFWIQENDNRKILFKNCLMQASGRLEHDLCMTMIDTAAKRCWEEFQNTYCDQLDEEIMIDDIQNFYTVNNKNYYN
ncbi:MAG TPA: hypothetical protein PLD54_00015 [Candidatus Levybacteria bacterium]|nr:hypothetical protein [Candidatus Levybacteria bacterium]